MIEIPMTNTDLPSRIHVLAKPTGSICNLNCDYCFYLKKESLYPGSRFRMSDELLEAYISQLIAAHRTDTVTVAWQGVPWSGRPDRWPMRSWPGGRTGLPG